MESFLKSLPDNFELHEFKLERVLGQGGFGITYLALDTNLMQHVAIKEYFPREFSSRDSTYTIHAVGNAEDKDTFSWGLKRFLAEARVLAQLSHPNIVSIKRFFEAHGTAYLVMEYCDGKPLDEIIRDRGPLNESQLNEILFPLLDGLEHVHGKAFLHRDVKPANIFIRRDGTPVLLDFGAAKHEMPSQSKSVTSLATAGYAPFEQYSTKGRQGAWSDIYGLAATIYRAISGVKPQDAPDRMLEDSLVPAVELVNGKFPISLLTALDKALAIRPEARPQTIEEFRNLIQFRKVNTSPKLQVVEENLKSECSIQRPLASDIEELLNIILDLLEECNAENVVAFNTEHLTTLFERVIVASATSVNETKSLASRLEKRVSTKGFPAPRVAGQDIGEWIILDCGSVIVHIMQTAARHNAKLEEIWGDTPILSHSVSDKAVFNADNKNDLNLKLSQFQGRYLWVFLIFVCTAGIILLLSRPRPVPDNQASVKVEIPVGVGSQTSSEVTPVVVEAAPVVPSVSKGSTKTPSAVPKSIEEEITPPPKKIAFSFEDIDRAIQAGQLANAQTLLKEVIRSNPDNAGAHFRMGQIFASEDKYPEAREQLNKASKLDPSLRFTAPGKFQELYNEILAMEKMSKLPGRD